MKKKMNQGLALMAAAAMAAGMLAGCGSGSGSGTTTGTTDAGSTQAADDSSQGQVTLTFSIWDSTQQPGMDAMAEQFEKENPDIKVNVELTPWDQYWTKMQAAGSGNSMADVFWMHPDQVFTYAEGGKLMDLTEDINAGNIDMSKFDDNVSDCYKIDGKQYAVPKDNSTFGLWYNKDIFDAKGIAYPDDTWDWDKLKEVAAELTDADNGVYGYLAENNTQNTYYHFIWQNGGDIINEDNTASAYDSPETIEAMAYLSDFVAKGYSPSPEQFANTSAMQYFESGKGAMIIAGSWNCNELTSIEGLNCDVAPLPQGKQRAGLSGGMGYSIAANTAHPAEALKFVEWLAGEEANTIQAQSGAAIPDYAGTQSAWVEMFPNINAQVFVDAFAYGKSSQYCKGHAEWTDIENQYTNEIMSGSMTAEEACKELAEQVDNIMATLQ